VDLNIRGEMEAAAAELESTTDESAVSSPDASPAPEPESTTSDQPAAEASDSAPAPATEEPAPAEKAESAPPEEYELPLGGSIPVPRVRKILENARSKAKAEAQAELQALTWAREYKPEDVSEAVRIVQFANDSPFEFLEAVMGRLRNTPQYAEEFSRRFAALTQPQQAAAPPAEPKSDRPQPDVLLEDGRLVYSADQTAKLLEWQERQLDGKVSEKLRPFEDERKRRQVEAEVSAQAKRTTDEALTWPGMDVPENRKAVAETMLKHGVNVEQAYRMTVVPKFTTDAKAQEEQIRKRLLAELKQKGRASTENPQRGLAPAESFKGKSVREILELTAQELGMTD